MIIEKLHIDSFGRLEDFELSFKEGMNIIEGKNESGKSTLSSFIKFIFYGIPSKDRENYVSWKTGRASGTIEFSTAQGRFRVERSLSGGGKSGKITYREVLQTVDLSSNLPCGLSVSPGEHFFGVDADLFEATAYVSQNGGNEVGGSKVAESIENLLFSADESVNTQRALSKLDSARVLLLHKNEKGGKLFEIENRCAALEERLKKALAISDEIRSKEAQLDDVKENRKKAEERAKTLGAKLRQFEVRSLVEIFGKMKKTDERVNELRNMIDSAGAPDPDEVNALSATVERLKNLRQNLAEAQSEVEAVGEKEEPDGLLSEYISEGGRESVESKSNGEKKAAKIYRLTSLAVGVVGLAALLFGIIPLMTGAKEPIWIPVIAAIIMFSASVSMLVLAGGASKRAEAISDKFDCDMLDARISEMNEKNRAREAAAALRDAAKKQLSDALSGAAERFGETDYLDEKLKDYLGRLSAVDDLKKEYDKYHTVLVSMKEQLASYDEEELTGEIDESIDIAGLSANNLPALRRELDFDEKSVASLSDHEVALEKELAGLYPGAESAPALDDRLRALKDEKKELSKKLAAYRLAYEKLEQASSDLRESVSPYLADEAAKLMDRVTDSKYNSLGVGSQLEMTADTDAGTKYVKLLSAGTRDAAYVCLRMALAKLVFRKELPPLIFDESFSRLDDGRLSKMLGIIKGSAQSLVFTSNDRDRRLLSDDKQVNFIRLGE